MSITQLRASGTSYPAPRVTAASLLQKKHSRSPITALTAYDYPTARLVDEAGIDMVLVGDSVGMAVLGYENTLPVTMEEMLHHTRAVARGVRRALLVSDMPYGSYHVSVAEGVAKSTFQRLQRHLGVVMTDCLYRNATGSQELVDSV